MTRVCSRLVNKRIRSIGVTLTRPRREIFIGKHLFVVVNAVNICIVIASLGVAIAIFRCRRMRRVHGGVGFLYQILSRLRWYVVVCLVRRHWRNTVREVHVV